MVPRTSDVLGRYGSNCGADVDAAEGMAPLPANTKGAVEFNMASAAAEVPINEVAADSVTIVELSDETICE